MNYENYAWLGDDWLTRTTSVPRSFVVGVKVTGLAPNTKKPSPVPAAIAKPSQTENVTKIIGIIYNCKRESNLLNTSINK
jgi:hypothetical protein